MPVFPATITIQHQSWTFDTDSNGDPVLDADGNPTGSLGPPVTRKIIGFQQMGEGQTQDPISPDYVQRTITDILMEVPDGSIYNKLDRVLLPNAAFGTPGPQEGVAFEVMGFSPTWQSGLPWRHYAKLFGDTVLIRRVM
jgi:peptidoglycan hydrolase-like protein with peptidoglycan-binding domain